MSSTPPISQQSWDTKAYAANGRFVANLATAVVQMLDPRHAEHILDLGCGDGALTAQLASTGATVIGVDNSPSMLEAARARGLRVEHHSADVLPYHHQFDAVFSNAALHWLSEDRHPALLAGVHRALKPGGRFIAEMGGQGNIAAIRTALSAALAPYGIDTETAAASFYPSPAVYRHLLEQAGFTVESIELIPRPTPLPNGMEAWLTTFRNGVLDQLATNHRTQAIAHTVSLLEPVLRDGHGNWTADYVRLRFAAKS
ncbi:MAG: class I SAM-dependent methyltransferase [Acidobacteria bacterium]|nr:class I SAM-dependent methyltransferase [Acidobacteriota bacterium]